jgi:putative ABC transport system permease protein
MNIVEVASFAYKSLTANKLRAGLTMLGMIIGTASIILVVTIALTGRDYILKQIEGIGSNLIYLYYEAAGTVSGSRSLSDELTIGDLEAIKELPDVSYAAGIVTNHDRVLMNGQEREVSVIGVTKEYLQVRNLRILSGRFFDDADDRSFHKVCLLNEEFARKAFGSIEARGRTLKFFQVQFEIIGVFKEGVETFGQSEVSTYTALIPQAVMKQFSTADKLDVIYASARTGDMAQIVTMQIEQILEKRHRKGSAYRVENLTEILQAAARIATALTIVLFLIGAISLVISGIGIMNIMLVTVTERTKEIGIKMAIGARRREILYQFLAESVALATTGGVLGILLGVSGPLMAKWIAGFNIPISWIAILVAFMLSLIIGVTFGLIPANQAAKLNPIEALRYE